MYSAYPNSFDGGFTSGAGLGPIPKSHARPDRISEDDQPWSPRGSHGGGSSSTPGRGHPRGGYEAQPAYPHVVPSQQFVNPNYQPPYPQVQPGYAPSAYNGGPTQGYNFPQQQQQLYVSSPSPTPGRHAVHTHGHPQMNAAPIPTAMHPDSSNAAYQAHVVENWLRSQDFLRGMPATLPVHLNSLQNPQNAGERPPYTMHQLAAIAIASQPRQRASSKEIRTLLEARYPFFRENSKELAETLKHALSSYYLFVRVDRSAAEPGRGGLWELDVLTNPSGRRTRKRGSGSGGSGGSGSSVESSPTPPDANVNYSYGHASPNMSYAPSPSSSQYSNQQYY